MSRKTRKPQLWLAIALVAWCGNALALEPQTLTELLENARAEKRMPGLRAAIRYTDGRIVRAAVGLGDREAGTPLDDTVGMPGGSTGKTFVAAVTMLLVEDGTLSLDDKVSQWLGRTDVRHYASSGLTVAVQANRDGRVELDKLIARLAAAAAEPE